MPRETVLSIRHYDISFKITVLLSAILLTLPGCNGGSDVEPETTTTDTSSSDSATDSGNNGMSAGAPKTATDSQGRKSIDGIPYDVFFDDPLAVVAQQGTVAPSVPTGTPSVANNDTPTETPEPEPMPKEEPKAATIKWDNIIPMEYLDNEIKSIRNFLTPTLQSVGAYNREYKQIPMHGNTMAALAQVALAHPGDALWKDQAAALRDISYNMGSSADAPGRAGFEASSVQFENLLQIFNGSEPTLEEEPDPNLAFADKADRGPLMRRMEVAFNWLSSNTPTPAAFVDVKDKAMHETIILGALTQIVADESYLFADEPDYKNHINEMMAAVEQMRKGIDDGNHEIFREGVSTITKKCAECHTDYKE